MKLASINDRTAAERFTGLSLFVRERDAVPPPPGSWYIHDLLGCEVLSEKGEFIGSVSDVLEVPGQHLWAVKNGDSVFYIPAVKEFIARVDITGRRIVVRELEGLLDI